MTCLVSLFYSSMFYGKMLHSRNIKKEHHMARIFYCYFMTGLIWAGFDDRIATMMTVQTVIFLILTAVFYELLIVKRMRLW